MVRTSVRAARFALLLIGCALMGQTTVHAQTPTPKPGHGPLSLEPHSAPVAGCIAKCRSLSHGSVGDFLACLATCKAELPKPTNTERPTRTSGLPMGTRKPTNTERPTRTATGTPGPPTVTPTPTPCLLINCIP